MDRRTAVATLLATPLLPIRAMAAAPKQKRVGFVSASLLQRELIANPRAFPNSRLMIEGLRDLGWREGENIEFVWRAADGFPERLDAIYAELIALPVDVLVVHGRVLQAAKRTRTIPIVVNGAGSSEYLRSDGSKNFPANVTGTTYRHTETLAKALSLLVAVASNARRIAVAFDERLGPGLNAAETAMLEAAATALRVALAPAPYGLDSPEHGLDRALASGAEAIYFYGSGGMNRPGRQMLLHAWTRRHRIPAIHGFIESAETGGLLAYAPDQLAIWRRGPYFVDRLLRGGKPEEMPLEQPQALRFVVNLEAARAIGVTIPQEVLLQADRVIGVT